MEIYGDQCNTWVGYVNIGDPKECEAEIFI